MSDHSNQSEDAFLEKIAATVERGQWYRAMGMRNALLFWRAQQLLERQGLQLRPLNEGDGNQKYRRAWNEFVDAVADPYGNDDAYAAASILKVLADFEDHLSRPWHGENDSDALARIMMAYADVRAIERLTQQYMQGEIEGFDRGWQKADADRERMKDINDAHGRKGDWHEKIFVLVAREQHCDQTQGEERDRQAIYRAAGERLDVIEPADEFKDPNTIAKTVNRKWERFCQVRIAAFAVLDRNPQIDDRVLVDEVLRCPLGQQSAPDTPACPRT